MIATGYCNAHIDAKAFRNVLLPPKTDITYISLLGMGINQVKCDDLI